VTAEPAGRRAPRCLPLLAAAVALAPSAGLLSAQTSEALLHVPASTRVEAPVVHPAALSAGERLLIEVGGEVQGFEPDSAGGISVGALVASLDGGPPFLVGGPPSYAGVQEGAEAGKLLWTAPSAGRLAFAVAPGNRELAGGYTVRVEPLGPRGDPRQRRFPAPWITFTPPSETAAFLEVRYGDRSGFGLDRKTLQVIVDTERGERFVLSPYFQADPGIATLDALPPEVNLPPGVHRVTAAIGDALGNASIPAEIFLDEP
jgi:hypothetical protein